MPKYTIPIVAAMFLTIALLALYRERQADGARPLSQRGDQVIPCTEAGAALAARDAIEKYLSDEPSLTHPSDPAHTYVIDQGNGEFTITSWVGLENSPSGRKKSPYFAVMRCNHSTHGWTLVRMELDR